MGHRQGWDLNPKGWTPRFTPPGVFRCVQVRAGVCRCVQVRAGVCRRVQARSQDQHTSRFLFQLNTLFLGPELGGEPAAGPGESGKGQDMEQVSLRQGAPCSNGGDKVGPGGGPGKS